MSVNRKSVQLERVGGKSPREVIWAEIRRQRTFNLKSLSQRVRGSTEDAIRSYLTCLLAADYLTPVSNSEPISYALTRDCGVEAPRVRKDGTAVTQGLGRDNMWRTLRILKTVDWQSLAMAATTEEVTVSERTAKSYIEILTKAGYLRCIDKGSAGVKAVYRIVAAKCNGAHAPMIQRGGHLYDPNLNQVVYKKGECHE